MLSPIALRHQNESLPPMTRRGRTKLCRGRGVTLSRRVIGIYYAFVKRHGKQFRRALTPRNVCLTIASSWDSASRSWVSFRRLKPGALTFSSPASAGSQPSNRAAGQILRPSDQVRREFQTPVLAGDLKGWQCGSANERKALFTARRPRFCLANQGYHSVRLGSRASVPWGI